ncbi:phage major capsid protein [Weissella oryzae SG25]|uniref:Phage major capsid protein n=1 Tax=Weissella oryzae (strain DSM 25784 / JCM 18191 / LMG 30913 / SG25) TaxID=1329250 RepID=A0A069CS19_WEIOS|nr:phage major capsid protein [Weissella oryzae]GAK30214.1 phage major capsid protein [Weissella oryzae SG25]
MTMIEKLTKKIAEQEKNREELRSEIRSAVDDEKSSPDDVKEKMAKLDKADEELNKSKNDLNILKAAKDKTESDKSSNEKNNDKQIKDDSKKNENSNEVEKRDENDDIETRSKEGMQMKTKVAPNKKDVALGAFEKFLRTGETRDVTGLGLSDGAVIIPEAILPVEHENYQFPRLGSLVRTVSVTTTTGKLPVFMNSTDSLSEHTEYKPTGKNANPEIKPILWDLKTYTGAYVFSQELMSDSSFNWQAELQGRLSELRDNTDDGLIINALTSGITVEQSTDIIASLKTALNVTLKPADSNSASIVLSQSAYNALDQLKDGEGRPMLQPSITNASGETLLGKQVTIVEDTLFPKAKAGDINIVVAPLKKAVINFKLTEITGQFQDTYDIWYKQLGIFLRENVVQARKDLIINITGKVAPVTEPTTDK